MARKAKGKHRLDKYYHLAKEQGYRSRAAFKLVQLNRKYNFLHNARAVLDLCAAPGGWLQIAAKNMPVSSLILGVDLVPIRPIRGCVTIIGDITTQKCRQDLKKAANGSSMDVVLHDGAPNVGGAWSSEAYTQSALVLEALRLATEFLAPNGIFVTKVFRSKDYTSLLYAFNQLFNKVDATKPAASRNESAEIFVVCMGYKAPGKIDPRLLDPKHLFQEVEDVPVSQGPDALLKHKIKQQRHREGYADGLSTTHRQCSAVQFITTEAPVEMLGQYTRFILEGPGSEVSGGDADEAAHVTHVMMTHPDTTAEIRRLCADLQVLGRSEFKQLLKWRLNIKKALALEAARQQKDEQGEAQGGESGDGDAVNPEEALLLEMAEMKERLEKKRKNDRRKRRELKKKARIRAAQVAQSEGIQQDEEGLFSLAAVNGDIAETAALSASELSDIDRDSDDDVSSAHDDSDLDSEEEQRRYDQLLDEELEDSYQQYLVRQQSRKAAEAAKEAAKKKRKRLGMTGELEEEDARDGANNNDGHNHDAGVLLDHQDSDEDGKAGHRLLVELEDGRAGRGTSAEVIAAQWFSGELFNDPKLMGDDEQENDKKQHKKQHKKQDNADRVASGSQAEAMNGTSKPIALAKSAAGGKLDSSSNGVPQVAVEPSGDDGSDEDDVDAKFIKQQKKKRSEAKAAATGQEDEQQDADFEVVPQGHANDSSSDEEELDDLDDDAKAEIMAIAKKMRSGRAKHDILEAAYNRYAFHDDHLPIWFMQDEAKHMRPVIDIGKDDIDSARTYLQAIDARPIKKVAEAKARKKKRLQAKLSAARSKAEAIAAQEDVPMASKMKEIEKVMSKARSQGKGKGKGKGKKKGRDGKRRGPPLDKRLRADKRQVNMKKKKAVMKKRKPKAKGKKGGSARE